MPTLKKRITEIIWESCSKKHKNFSKLAEKILLIPQIQKALKLLKERRIQEKWERKQKKYRNGK